MQANLNKKLAYLGAILMLATLSSCSDNARAQECSNMKTMIDKNNAEITSMSSKQKPFSTSGDNTERAMIGLQIAQISEANTKLSQDYQIKCGK
jgi:hypothetical protein